MVGGGGGGEGAKKRERKGHNILGKGQVKCAGGVMQ